MFTGIIQSIGKVVSMRCSKGGKIIKIHPLQNMESLSVGESIAVNGVCLTICEVIDNWFEVYAGSRTLSYTNLSKLTVGSKVNLERALRISDRISGHLVQGHIDGLGKVVARRVRSGSVFFSISPPVEYMKYLVSNGSVAIDGVSLTIVCIRDNHFEVALIPYTLENTTLGALRVNDLVNIEVDIIGKYLVKQ